MRKIVQCRKKLDNEVLLSLSTYVGNAPRLLKHGNTLLYVKKNKHKLQYKETYSPVDQSVSSSFHSKAAR